MKNRKDDHRGGGETERLPTRSPLNFRHVVAPRQRTDREVGEGGGPVLLRYQRR
jgi:hypothetical protein